MPKRSKKSKKQVNTTKSNIYPDLRGQSCPKYPVHSRPLTNISISSTSREIVLLKSINDFQDNPNLNQNQRNSFIFNIFGDVMGNVSSEIHRNSYGKTSKKCYKLKKQNFNNITEKVNANINLEIAKTSYNNNMNNTNDSNISLETLNETNNIENIISPEQIVTQVVSLARDSIDSTKKLQSIDVRKIDSDVNNDDTKYNVANSITIIDELPAQSTNNHSLIVDRHEKTSSNAKDINTKYKGSRRKDKQIKENALLEVTNNIFTKKGILKKEDLENEEAGFYLTAGFNAIGNEIPLQLTDPENIFNSNITINSVHNVSLKNGTASAYVFETKRKKNRVRFNDNVVIIYYTAECQQQAIRNGTFITSVVEPLKVALQQQQRNRELRNKHSYTHTIFPTAVRCGKS